MKSGFPYNSIPSVEISSLRLYRDLAEYYFTIENAHRDFELEINFLRNLFPLAECPRLVDLGCGTGEHINALHALGYTVLGIDISNNMLQIARKRFPAIRVICDDMKQLNITGEYDGFFSLFGTMDYLLDDLSIRKFLRGIYQRLRKYGLMVLELWNAEPIQKIKKKPISNVSSVIYNGKVIHRNRGFQVVPSGSLTQVKVNYLYQIDDEEIEDCHYMRVFFKNEIEKFIPGAGFRIEQIYKNFNCQPFQESSSRMLIIARKL